MVQVGGRWRFTLHTSSTVYHLDHKFFKKVELLPGTNPVAAHHFEVNEFHYLAFANYQDNKGETRKNEQITLVLHDLVFKHTEELTNPVLHILVLSVL